MIAAGPWPRILGLPPLASRSSTVGTRPAKGALDGSVRPASSSDSSSLGRSCLASSSRYFVPWGTKFRVNLLCPVLQT